MKISYYPGCTLKTKARNLELSALAALKALGIEVEELERWNCCGAVFSISDDDIIHLVAPVRDLIRVKDSGADKVVTLCAQCYNVLARANQLVRDNEEKRKILNSFMDEESDYHGEVEVIHYLDLIREQIGFEELRKRVKKPLEGLKVAPFYGCGTVRPLEIAVGEVKSLKPSIFQDFIAALGATPIDYGSSEECCGFYQILSHPEETMSRSGKILKSAKEQGADALVLTCPLCEYNLGRKQKDIQAADEAVGDLPVYYFTQLLAIALGLEPESCHFDLNMEGAEAFLKQHELLRA